jgi:stage V sporulation protein G
MHIQGMHIIQSAQSKLRAFFNIEFDNGVVVKGFKIAEGPSGLFVGNPSEKDKDGKWWDKVYLPSHIKDEATDLAIAEYQSVIGGNAPAQRSEKATATPPAKKGKAEPTAKATGKGKKKDEDENDFPF